MFTLDRIMRGTESEKHGESITELYDVLLFYFLLFFFSFYHGSYSTNVEDRVREECRRCTVRPDVSRASR